jgi:drug/metabolite transporter (DMT)-like permease
MRRADATRLVALAALWGASFLFMRVAAPVLGPFIMADVRILLAAGALGLYFRWIGFDSEWRRWWREYALIGLINTALPFALYGYAAVRIPAGFLAVTNATAPIWVRCSPRSSSAKGRPRCVPADCFSESQAWRS